MVKTPVYQIQILNLEMCTKYIILTIMMVIKCDIFLFYFCNFELFIEFLDFEIFVLLEV